MHIDCHKQYLRSNVIGVRSSHPNKKLSIEHTFENRADEWIYVEGLNTSKKMNSLYEVELKIRIEN
ncbi:hypothetical protein ACFFU9_15205 [Mariniflexile ostreae]|uniref:Uncharacterized protein n=1 Tax=Mariniflexile ostreae TaxID=1520892 RepID=A0ABV5FF56_9FLAO